MKPRYLVVVLVLGLAAGYWSGTSNAPHRDRPVARWVAGVARQLLWVAAFAERPPEQKTETRIVRATSHIGDDGFPVIDHGRGL